VNNSHEGRVDRTRVHVVNAVPDVELTGTDALGFDDQVATDGVVLDGALVAALAHQRTVHLQAVAPDLGTYDVAALPVVNPVRGRLFEVDHVGEATDVRPQVLGQLLPRRVLRFP
jgi:hypothetical protein